MATDRLIEDRLATLEATVADLRRRLDDRPRDDWVRAIAGSVSDPAAFTEALAHGRALREAGRPEGGG